MSTAWAYAAVSSGRQELTLEDQLAWARDTAREQGWTITREFHGVASGNEGVRRTLTDLIDELRATPKAARPARVLMVRLDRLGRGLWLDPARRGILLAGAHGGVARKSEASRETQPCAAFIALASLVADLASA